jgi:hypothetical protein
MMIFHMEIKKLHNVLMYLMFVEVQKKKYLMLFPYCCGRIIICFDDDHNMVGPFHVWELSCMLIGM